jgi:hypothetical protein
MRADVDRNVTGRQALAHDFIACVVAEAAPDRRDRRQRRLAERLLERLLAGGADVGEAHAVGGQQRGERMDQHLAHAERIGDEARVLAAGAAEAVERVARHVVAALHRNFLDRVGHVLDRDPDEAVGDVFGRAAIAGLVGELRERLAHRVGIERQILLRPENLRKEIRNQLSDHDIGVGDRERPAAAVAFRSGIGAGAVGTDPEARAVEMQDRAAARRHGVDQHHRGAHAHARHLGLEGALVLAVEMRDVGRGAAHIEADQMREAGFASGLRHADHAGGRPGQNRILPLKQFGGGEAARRHHEHHARSAAWRALRFTTGLGGLRWSPCRTLRGCIVGNGAQILRHLRHVSPQDRGEIGVDHRGVAAADELDQRRDLVTHRYLREAELARERGHALLVLGIAIGVHEHDRDCADAGGACGGKLGPQRRKVGLPLHRAVGAHALVHLDHALVQHLRLDDVAGKNLRPGLVADL